MLISFFNKIGNRFVENGSPEIGIRDFMYHVAVHVNSA